MAIFGDDKKQDARLDALEAHVRSLTEDVYQNWLDLAGIRISMMGLEKTVGEKISVGEVDPDLIKLNEQLGAARKKSEEVTAAATESWATIQRGARESYETLRSSLEEAAERLK